MIKKYCDICKLQIKRFYSLSFYAKDDDTIFTRAKFFSSIYREVCKKCMVEKIKEMEILW